MLDSRLCCHLLDNLLEGVHGTLQISLSGEGCMVEALPKGCECAEMRCKGQKVWRPMGHAAGLGAYPQIKRLSLEGFR